MLKPRKIPLRMCVGCREMKPKKELLRVVRGKDGAVGLDLSGKAPGRGAYVCTDGNCLAKAQKSRQLDRALEHQIERQVYEQLTEEIAAHERLRSGD